MATLDNLFLAARKARRGKSRRPDVEAWWMRHEVELLALREELLSGSYTPGAYRFFTIYEPKQRLIAAAPFRDRVVHHALCNYMAPLLERRFIEAAAREDRPCRSRRVLEQQRSRESVVLESQQRHSRQPQ